MRGGTLEILLIAFEGEIVPVRQIVRAHGGGVNRMHGPLVNLVCGPMKVPWAIFLHPIPDGIIRMLQLVPLLPFSKKKMNEFGFTSGKNIMRRFLNAMFRDPSCSMLSSLSTPLDELLFFNQRWLSLIVGVHPKHHRGAVSSARHLGGWAVCSVRQDGGQSENLAGTLG